MSDHHYNPFGRGTKVTLPTRIRDAYGRPLSTGDMVVYLDPKVSIFEVIEVAPLLDPKAPPNAVRVTLAAVAQFAYPADQPLGVVRVQTATERGFVTDADAKGAADNGELRLIDTSEFKKD